MVGVGIVHCLKTRIRSGLLLLVLLAASGGIVLQSIEDFNRSVIELSEDIETECEGETSTSSSEVDLYSGIQVLKFNHLNEEIKLHQYLAGLLFHPVHYEVLTPPPEVA